MEIYIKIFEVIFPVFFVIGVGYYLGKKNPKFDVAFYFDCSLKKSAYRRYIDLKKKEFSINFFLSLFNFGIILIPE